MRMQAQIPTSQRTITVNPPVIASQKIVFDDLPVGTVFDFTDYMDPPGAWIKVNDTEAVLIAGPNVKKIGTRLNLSNDREPVTIFDLEWILTRRTN